MKSILRSIFTLTIVTAFSVSTSAQLGEGDLVSNFTGTDLNSVSHTLYDYLDDGKIVYVDVSATWCSPCWSLHESHLLKNLYEASGPDGTDEVMVLFIEGEGTNTTAQLYGPAGGSTYADATQGDWVTGTPYPIIDDASIGSILNVGYFPTLYRIYPDRSVELVNTAGATAQSLRDEEKTVELGTNSLDAKIFYKPFIEAIDCDGYLFPKFTLQNFGSTALTSATIELTANDEVVKTVSWTGNLPQYSGESVSFGLVNLEDGEYELKMKIKSPNGSTDENELNNEEVDYISVNRNGLNPSLTITSDTYGSEVSWKILNWNNVIVTQGSDYENGASASSNVTISQNLCLLDNQCYTFIIEDSFGDGFSEGGNGGEIVINGSSQLMSFTSAEHDGAILSKEFCLGTPTGIEEISTNSFEIFPNPMNNTSKVNFSLVDGNNVSVELVNIIGETIKTENLGNLNSGNYNHSLKVNNLEKGIYFINLTIGNETLSKKVIVQ